MSGPRTALNEKLNWLSSKTHDLIFSVEDRANCPVVPSSDIQFYPLLNMWGGEVSILMKLETGRILDFVTYKRIIMT